MTEKKLKRAEELRDKIRAFERALQEDVKGLYFNAMPFPNKGYIGLDDLTLGYINTVIRQRLEELKKEFEEL